MRRLAAACVVFLACSEGSAPVDSTAQGTEVGATPAGGTAPSGGAGSPAVAAAGGAGAGTTTKPSAGGAGAMAADAGSAGIAAAGAGGETEGASGSAAGAGGEAAGASGSAAGAGGETAGASGSAAGAGGETAGTSGSAAGAGGMMASAAPEVPGCEGSTLLELPADTSVRGPWPIGTKTVKFGRFSNVEVFYPAEPGSEQGATELEYDMRVFLPEREQQKVPDDQATLVKARTYQDLPLDTGHGPYPVMIFVHGTASFRLRSLSSATLWASRGFVVMAGDHPNLYLADYLGSNGCNLSVPRLDLSGDVDSEIAALSDPQEDLAFLKDHIDMQRVALAGHSAGAYNVAQFTSKPGIQMVVALSGTRAVSASETLKSILYVSGRDDNVLPYGPGGAGIGTILYPGSSTDAYNRSPGPSAVKKRLVGIDNGGHLNVVDGCAKNAMGKTGIQVAQDNGVCGASSVAPLADCGSVDPGKAISITNEIITAALEETLQCQDRAAWITALPMRHPEVNDFHEDTN